jgi:hypothetical protein
VTPGEAPSEWVALPARAIYALPVADTRSPLSSLLLRSGDTGGLQIDGALAADFPIVEWRPEGWRFGAGLAAGAFLQFGAGGELTFDLTTFDGLFALPIDVARGIVYGRVQWVHVSAHYGDGVRKGDDRPTNLDAWSREYLQAQVAVRLGPARVYAGGRGVLHALPAVPPLGFQLGAEIRGPWHVAPYAAADLQIAAESAWAPALSGQAGMEVAVTAASRLRVALAARVGPEDTGKLAEAHESWLGLLLGFDRTGG